MTVPQRASAAGATKAPAQQVQQPAPPRMTLASVKVGRERVPDRFFGYGVEKVGKSTFASTWPSPIFLSSEDGIHHLDVARFPEPRTWKDLVDALTVLEKEKHDYKTLVIDTIDWLEQRLMYPRAKREGGFASDSEAEEYARWIKIALHYHRELVEMLQRVRHVAGMHIVILAHAKTKSFNNPNGPDYTRFVPSFGGDAGYEIWKQWADSVGFLAFEDTVVKVKGKEKGNWTGARLMHLVRSAAFDAGSRWDTPASLPIDYDEYASYRDHDATDIEPMLKAARALIAELKMEGKELKQAEAWLAKEKNPTKLRSGINRLKVRLEKQNGAQQDGQSATDGAAAADNKGSGEPKEE